MKMTLLAIDTSGQTACAAIVDETQIVGEIALNARTGEKSWTHSEILMPGIDELFRLVGVDMHSIDYIAYTNGPGSFTGLRIGASTALGLGAGLNKPTIAVPTLDALAYNMKCCGHTVVPMMDARRGQVYSAIYSKETVRVSDYFALPVEDVLAQIPSEAIFLGDGACTYKDIILAAKPDAIFAAPNNNRQRASSAAVWAIEQIRAGFVPDSSVEILYVREPQAVQDLKRKANQEVGGV